MFKGRGGYRLTLARMFAGLICAAMAPILRAGAVGAPIAELAVVEERLGNAPGDEVEAIAFSRGAAHVAWVTKTPAGGGGEGQEAADRPRFLLAVDGRPTEEADEFGPIVYSPAGDRLMVSVRDGDRWRVVVDRQAGPGWQGVGQMVFSPDGRHWAYQAIAGPSKQHVVTDGYFGRPFASVGNLTYSADGRHFAHAAVDTREQFLNVVKVQRDKLLHASDWRKDCKQYVVADGVEGRLYPATGPPVFSPRGRRLAYVVRADDRQFPVVDGAQQAAYDRVGEPTFSSDGGHVLHGAVRDGKCFAVLDGHPGPPFEAIAEPGPIFGPHDTRVGFVARQGDAWTAVVDGIAGLSWDQIGENSLRLSADGERFAYAARRGTEWRVVVNATPGEAFDAMAVGTPLFSDDGRRLAYAAISNGKWHVVVDGRASAPYDDVGEGTPLFSLDGERVIYTAATPEGWRVIVDDRATRPFDQILGVPIATSRGVEFFGVRSGELLRCSVSF